MFIVIYSRYGNILKEELNDFKEAADRYNRIEDNGDGFGIAIFDKVNKIAFIKNEEVGDIDMTKLQERKLNDLGEEYGQVVFWKN